MIIIVLTRELQLYMYDLIDYLIELDLVFGNIG